MFYPPKANVQQLHEHCIHILVKLAKTRRCANAFFLAPSQSVLFNQIPRASLYRAILKNNEKFTRQSTKALSLILIPPPPRVFLLDCTNSCEFSLFLLSDLCYNLLFDRDLGYWRSFLISYKTFMSKHSERYMLNNHLTGNLLKHTGRQKSKRSRRQENNCCRHCASFGRSPHVLYMYTIQGVAWWGVGGGLHIVSCFPTLHRQATSGTQCKNIIQGPVIRYCSGLQ